MKYILLFAIVFSGFSVRGEVIASWNLDGQPGNQASSPAGYVSEFISGVPTLTRTSTIGSSGQKDTFSMRDNHQLSLQAAIDSNVYISWSVQAVAGYYLSLTDLFLNVSANNTHQPGQVPRQVSLFSSATGWNASEAMDSWEVTTWGSRSIDLSAIAGMQNMTEPVEFRLIAWNATGVSPEFHFTSIGRSDFTDGANDLVISGITTVIPEPAAAGLVALGGLLALLIRRYLS